MSEPLEQVFKAEVHHWAKVVGVLVREVHLRAMTRKWASASLKGRLTFSTHILHQPAEFRREVIVHELVHLKLGNGSHGKLFKVMVRGYLERVP
ncbi:MAG: M48 family peptidase [Gammaproteobacteria bacterium]|nr:MAG: M48 family peptidase [Gammaproteobacteria bacterium]